jgi:hypothetical protein
VIKKIWYPKKKVISCRLKKYSLSFKDYSARKEGKRNNRFLSLYDYNFLLVIEKIFSVNSKICGSSWKNYSLVNLGRLMNYYLKNTELICQTQENTFHKIYPASTTKTKVFSISSNLLFHLHLLENLL